MTFWIGACWNTFSIWKGVVFSAWCTFSVLRLSSAIKVNNFLSMVWWKTFSLCQLEVLLAWCAFSIEFAVLFTVLRNLSTDSIIIEEVSFLAFQTFSSSTLTRARFTERIYSSWNTISICEFIKIPALNTFSFWVLFGAVWIFSLLDSAFAIGDNKSFITLCALTFCIGGSTVYRKLLTHFFWSDIVAFHAFWADSILVNSHAICWHLLASSLWNNVSLFTWEAFSVHVSRQTILR